MRLGWQSERGWYLDHKWSEKLGCRVWRNWRTGETAIEEKV